MLTIFEANVDDINLKIFNMNVNDSTVVWLEVLPVFDTYSDIDPC